jgi:hypothetical protein
MKHNVRLGIALLLILVICWFGYIHTEEVNKISNAVKPLKQQILRFLWLISIGSATYWAFAKQHQKWIPTLIFLIYTIAIITLGLLGLIEFKWKLFSENHKELISGIRLFLSSPLPFMMAWFLQISNIQKESKGTKF